MCVCVCACVSLTDLSDQVDQHEAAGEEVSAAPGGLDVVSLLAPLEPHADAVLQEGADETQTSEVRQILLRDPQELQTHLHLCI